MSKKKEGPDFDALSDEARKHLKDGEEVLRLMGLDDGTIEGMKKAMVKLYDPSTGNFKLDSFEEFKNVMLPTLLESPAMEETLASAVLLDEPEFKPLWFSQEQLQPCLDDWDAWIGARAEDDSDFSAAEMLMDDTYEEERADLGQLFYAHYDRLLTPEVERAVYNALFEFSKKAKGEKRKLAKNGLNTFTLFPGKTNAFLQYLFVKSIVRNTDITGDLHTVAEDEEQLEDLYLTFEDSLFSILCEGEEMLWEDAQDLEDDEDWDEDEDEDLEDDEDWDAEEDEEGEQDNDKPF